MSEQPLNLTLDYVKYLKLIWRKKNLVIVFTLLFTIAWYFLAKVAIPSTPDYISSAIIKFDETEFRSGVTDVSKMQTQSKVMILETSSFLLRVIDSLGLNVIVTEPLVNRFTTIKNVDIKKFNQIGKYELKKNNGKIDIYYTNKIKDIENKFIGSLTYNQKNDITFDTDEFSFEIDINHFQKFNKLIFSFSENLQAVRYLRDRIKYSLDRSGTFLTIICNDVDPFAAAYLANTTANLFVDELFAYKRFRTSSILNSLEEQLEIARKELEESEDSYRIFRERNPYINLTASGADIIGRIGQNEVELRNKQNDLSQLQDLLAQMKDSKIVDIDILYSELINLMEAYNIPGIKVIGEQYMSSIASKNRLLSQNYSSEHPAVLEIEARLKSLRDEINRDVGEFESYLEKQSEQLTNVINSNQNNLRRLPRGELQLAELSRDREIKQRLYSNILIRYNEAKLTHASMVPDAFVIERAEAPVVDYDLIGHYGKYAIGPLLGLILGVITILLMDFFDKTVKEPGEIEAKLNLPVLATIPVIISDKNTPKELNPESNKDEKLITSDYAPHTASEMFRVARTKLLTMMNSGEKALIISSLQMGEGKSLVSSNLAITFAQQKIPTILVDCDMRRGVLHKSFGLSKRPGISDLLMGNSPLTSESISKVIQETHIPNLYIISSGQLIPNPSELLGGKRMRQLFHLLKENLGMIVFDTPPIEYMPDALVLNTLVGNMIFVVKYGKTNLKKLEEKVSEYSNIKKDILGILLNSAKHLDQKAYSYSYYQY